MMRSLPSATRAACLAALALLLAATAAHAGFDQAVAYFKAGNWLEASARFQALVDESPAYDYGHYMLGHCLLRMGRPDEAAESFRRAVELREDRPEYHHGLALAAHAQKRYVQALGALSSGIPLVRDSRTAWSYLVLRAWTLAAIHRWSDAASDLEKAIAIRGDPALLDMLGRAEQSLGHYDHAARALSLALQARPDDGDLLRRFSDALIRVAISTPDPERKRAAYAQAVAAARRLRAAAPDDAAAAELHGRAALGAGLFEEAEGALAAALASRPGWCPATINLGRALQGQGRLEEAEARLLEAASCAPTAPEVHESLGGVYFRLHRFERALEFYRRAEGLMPSPTARAGIEASKVRLQSRRESGGAKR